MDQKRHGDIKPWLGLANVDKIGNVLLSPTSDRPSKAGLASRVWNFTLPLPILYLFCRREKKGEFCCPSSLFHRHNIPFKVKTKTKKDGNTLPEGLHLVILFLLHFFQQKYAGFVV